MADNILMNALMLRNARKSGPRSRMIARILSHNPNVSAQVMRRVLNNRIIKARKLKNARKALREAGFIVRGRTVVKKQAD